MRRCIFSVAPLPPAAEIEAWFLEVDATARDPALIRSGRAAREWMNRTPATPRSPAGMFLAASVWRESDRRRSISLPFWSAPELHHNRLDLQVGLPWMAGFLDCVAHAAKIGIDELTRLQRAEPTGKISNARRARA